MSMPTDVQTTLATVASTEDAKDLLRFITCGSVDDGKSTLIGRLLLEAGAIYEDQIQALQQDSERHGTTGDAIDSALLLDGLEDERQQGITIDVAYRYFTTPRRKFIIADTPGHEQFTRNMATGASTADLAVILVDATKGILTQTKRHAFIVSLLGIKHIVLAVNKMDLVDYQRSVFDELCDVFRTFAKRIDVPDMRFIPLSALKGDNLVEPSSNMLWYEDGSLLHTLESVYVGSDQNLTDLRFPVQWVNRPNSDFRGVSGTVASGTVRPGDEVVILPSRKRSRVERIVTMDGDLQEAHASSSVTLTLDDELDVTRGDMLVRPGNLPAMGREAEVMLVWMSEQPLNPGRHYWLKQIGGRTSCEIEAVEYSVDVNSLHRQAVSALNLNEIGRCRIVTHDPITFDSYRRNRQTGSFILVDRITHETVSAGMFLDHSTNRYGSGIEIEKAATSLRPVHSSISTDTRAQKYGHGVVTILITGLSNAGKTTLAMALERRLFEDGRIVTVLDGENMRLGLSRDLGFSSEESSENLRRAAEVARLVNESGQVCIAAFVAPEEAARQQFKHIVGHERCLHVHLSTPVAVCRDRDASGRYTAADRNEIRRFPGVQVAYEYPESPDVVFSTEGRQGKTNEDVSQILLKLQSMRIINTSSES